MSCLFFVIDEPTSYGALFINSLLGASTISTSAWFDRMFNIRDNSTGLDVDFMSYASYAQTEANGDALTDQAIFLQRTQNTFATFFKHFVSSSVSLQTGGWAYQPIDARLDDLAPPAPVNHSQIMPGGQVPLKFSDYPPQNTVRVTTATKSSRVEMLKINPIAFWVSIAILVWLSLTIVIVAVFQKWHLGALKRNVESVADYLVLIAGSPKLLRLVREQGVKRVAESDIRTRLGWFMGEDGRQRWGIEVVGP
jgi:hypothetical protein